MIPNSESAAELDAELKLDEGDRLYAYDDATGARIVPGYTMKGNVTAGTGTNLQFLYPEEDAFLLHNREQKAVASLTSSLAWFGTLDPVRRDAIIDLYYNVPSFVRWPKFTGFCAAGDWDKASAELLATQPWASQVGLRASRIAAKLKAGTLA